MTSFLNKITIDTMILSYFILHNRLCHVSTIQWGKERIKGKNRGIDDLR